MWTLLFLTALCTLVPLCRCSLGPSPSSLALEYRSSPEGIGSGPREESACVCALWPAEAGPHVLLLRAAGQAGRAQVGASGKATFARPACMCSYVLPW